MPNHRARGATSPVPLGPIDSFFGPGDPLLVDESYARKRCDVEGLDAIDRARTLSAVNAIAWGLGAAATGAGVVLIIAGSG